MYHYFIQWYILVKIYICKRLHDINQKTSKKVLQVRFIITTFEPYN